MSPSSNTSKKPLNIAILTVSDTRTLDNDTSGQYLLEAAESEGHVIVDRKISIDDIFQLRAVVSNWIANDDIQIIITTGGTGFTERDNTPEALTPLFEKALDGFGELFRHLSYQEIGTSTVQSRCLAGMANKTIIFCVPGSTGACKTAWTGILKDQLNSQHKPCNFAPHVS